MSCYCKALLLLLVIVSAVPAQSRKGDDIVPHLLKEGQRLGFDEHAERAIKDAFFWLTPQQDKDGHWAAGKGTEPGCTGLVLLALYGTGQSRESKYGENVKLALRYLTRKQTAQGNFHVTDRRQHALATMALSEAYAQERFAALSLGGTTTAMEGATKSGLSLIVKTQNTDGGWSKTVTEPSDLLTTAWSILALQAGETAGIKIPEVTHLAIRTYFEKTSLEGGKRFAWQAGGTATDEASVVGLALRAAFFEQEEPAVAQAILELGKQKLPEQLNSQTLLFTAIALRKLKHEKTYKKWYGQLVRELPACQQQAGSWHADKGEKDDEFHVTLYRLLALESSLAPAKLKAGLGMFR